MIKLVLIGFLLFFWKLIHFCNSDSNNNGNLTPLIILILLKLNIPTARSCRVKLFKPNLISILDNGEVSTIPKLLGLVLLIRRYSLCMWVDLVDVHSFRDTWEKRLIRLLRPPSCEQFEFIQFVEIDKKLRMDIEVSGSEMPSQGGNVHNLASLRCHPL